MDVAPNNQLLVTESTNANGLVVMDSAAAMAAPLDLIIVDPALPHELFCICSKPETMDMIACDGCDLWFHAHCFGINLVSHIFNLIIFID